MNLLCVQTRCKKCGAEAYRSAGVFARATGKPLTGHTAVLIPVAIGCLGCGSDQVDVFNPNSKTAIVLANKTPRCRICNNYIPEKFLGTFPLADFCPLCVKQGLVSDANIIAAYGNLFPKYGSSVAGEAYRFMSMEFRWQASYEVSQMKWLRKAANEGDIFACQTLGDILSRSSDPVDLADAAMAYEVAAGGSEPSIVRYAENRLALMLFKGKGQPADPARAIELMFSAAAKGASYALSDLGQFYFNGEYGLVPDAVRAFDCYQKAFEMCPKSMTDSAATALMLLEGVGTKVDENKGAEILHRAISIYGENKTGFNLEDCFREVMAARQLKEGQVAELQTARIYLDWMVKMTVPIAASLLARCGGALPPHKPRWELSLWKVLPDNIKIDLWFVRSPVRNRIGSPTTLGQVERLQNRQWIATTDDGVPVGETFNTRKDAVEALASALNCDVPCPIMLT